MMNSDDARIIHTMIREKYPPQILPAKVLADMIDVLLNHFAEQEELSNVHRPRQSSSIPSPSTLS